MARKPIPNKPDENEDTAQPAADENPFDVLAEHAENEYRAGRTRSLRDFAGENDIPLGERKALRHPHRIS